MLCVTLGAGGAMLLAGNEIHHEPGIKVKTVDTTGAGDVFRGAFIYALLRGDAPREIVRFANAAAALSCTRIGAMASIPSLHELKVTT
jgi:sugar/nucleoside kinase (ribokinase family)